MSKSIICNEEENDNINHVTSSNGIKIFNNHIQLLNLLATLPFNFPFNFSFSLSVALSISPSDPGSAFSLECFLKNQNWNFSLHYFKLIATYLYPFVILIVITCIFSIIYKTKFFEDWQNLMKNLIPHL